MPERRHLDSVDSTMEVAHRMARDGAEHGAAVVAARQEGARGTRGRVWSSGPGGLWVSVVVRPGAGAHIDLVPLRLGLRLAEALSGWAGAGPEIMVKWPNDLQVDGRKVGGILCEARWRGDACQWIVAGIGINVANAIPDDLAHQATRLADHGVGVDALAELTGVAIAAAARGGSDQGELTADELDRWRRRDALLGRHIVSPLAGMADGITPAGALRVVGDDGVRRLATSGVAPSAL